MSGHGPNAPHLRPEELVGALHDRPGDEDVDALAVEWARENYWEMEEREVAANAFRAGWAAAQAILSAND